MYTVTIYDKSKNKFRTYQHISSIEYLAIYDDDWTKISGKEILSHLFPSDAGYHLMSDVGNYSIEASLIGMIEIEKEP